MRHARRCGGRIIPGSPCFVTEQPVRIPESAAVVVIGGGIIGVSTAYFLARKGIPVVLFEKGRIAGEQSSRNWGFVRPTGTRARGTAAHHRVVENLAGYRGRDR